jgi:hypothetical protein
VCAKLSEPKLPAPSIVSIPASYTCPGQLIEANPWPRVKILTEFPISLVSGVLSGRKAGGLQVEWEEHLA